MNTMRDQIQNLLLRFKSDNEAGKSHEPPLSKKPSVDSDINDDDQAEIKRQLENQVKLGFKRRDGTILREIFDKFCVETKLNDSACMCLPQDRLLPALEEVGNHISRSEVNLDSLMQSMDLNNDGIIDFDEFKAAAQMRSPLSQWADGLPFAEIFSDAIPKWHLGKDPLRAISSLTPEERNAVHDAFCQGVKDMLDAESKKLSGAFKVLDEKAKTDANSAALKFQVSPMSCGKVGDYHKGLANRVGHPHLKFMEAMEAEHCRRAGCDHKFVTNNYKIETTPRREWKITVEFDMSDVQDADRAFGRRFVKIEVCMKCTLVTESKLDRSEVIAVVLYTGPMFFVLNCILRRWPEDLYAVFSEGGNSFSTTINVLVSSHYT